MILLRRTGLMIGWLIIGLLLVTHPLMEDRFSLLGANNTAEQKDRADLGGIQWFAGWESGLAEAKRTGRPILLVSAAPHCAGVSGIW